MTGGEKKEVVGGSVQVGSGQATSPSAFPNYCPSTSKSLPLPPALTHFSLLCDLDALDTGVCFPLVHPTPRWLACHSERGRHVGKGFLLHFYSWGP